MGLVRWMARAIRIASRSRTGKAVAAVGVGWCNLLSVLFILLVLVEIPFELCKIFQLSVCVIRDNFGNVKTIQTLRNVSISYIQNCGKRAI